MEREHTAAAAILGLPGFVVLAVSEVDGELERAVETTADLVGCPASLTQRARAETTGSGRRVGGGSGPRVGIGSRTAMTAVRDYGTPRVGDLNRLEGVQAIGLDETTFQAASPTRSTSFVTGIVDLTRGLGPARLLDVVAGRSAWALISWGNDRHPAWCTGVRIAALDPYRG